MGPTKFFRVWNTKNRGINLLATDITDAQNLAIQYRLCRVPPQRCYELTAEHFTNEPNTLRVLKLAMETGERGKVYTPTYDKNRLVVGHRVFRVMELPSITIETQIMGVFDYVHIHIPLPEGFEQYQDDDYQTKDFDEMHMRELHVAPDGQIYVREWDLRDLTDEEILQHKEQYAGTIFADFPPMMTRLDTYVDYLLEDVHQDVRCLNREDHDGRIEVTIRFTNGVVQSVKAQKFAKGEYRKPPIQEASYTFPLNKSIET